ncbi:MAG: translation initiation factor IF-5A [Candidatus Ranarchaeia archaeon]
MSKKIVEAGTLKKGSYVIIDNEPYKVIDNQKSKSGKHGHAKSRITAVNLLTQSKKSIVVPTDTRLESPEIDKRSGQVVSIQPGFIQVMDLETYDTIDIPKPDEEDILNAIKEGATVEYWNMMGTCTIRRVKGSG